MKLKKEYRENKRLYIGFAIAIAFSVVQLVRMLYVASEDRMIEKLQSAVEEDAYTYSMNYFLSDSASTNLGENENEIFLLAQEVSDNMSQEEIEALARQIAEETAKSVVSSILTRNGSLGSDIFFAKISAAIDERMAKNLLKLSDYDMIASQTKKTMRDEIAFKAKTEASKLNSMLLSKVYVTQSEKNTILNEMRNTIYKNIVGELSLEGKDGANGLTPKKGIDYMTSTEVQAIATQIQNKIIDSGTLVVTGKAGTNGLTDYELALLYVDNTLSMEEWEDHKTPDIGVDYFTAEEITGYNDFVRDTVYKDVNDSITSISGKPLGETISIENDEINALYGRITQANIDNNQINTTVSETQAKIDQIYDELQIEPSTP